MCDDLGATAAALQRVDGAHLDPLLDAQEAWIERLEAEVKVLRSFEGDFALAQAAAAHTEVLPDPATTPVRNPPFPENLTAQELAHLKTFDELDFDVYSNADWARLAESHAQNIRVHYPDGHFTDGIERHIADLSARFVWAPDTRNHGSPDTGRQERVDRRHGCRAGHLHPANA